MKKILLFSLLYGLQFAVAQNPLVKIWDKRYGGTQDDECTDFQQTRDGGYILGGSTNSVISGDKTQALKGNTDYWIVKLDSLGIKQWDKDFGGINFGGPTGWNNLTALQQTADGGYILGGSSNSGVGGDKTQPNWDTINGSSDYWIVKTNALGIKQWDKRFGGTEDDELYSLQQTSDGGYILGGFSRSGISGDKTEASRGYEDYWIVKTDSLGIKQWDKRFGGGKSDYLYSLKQTRDGGYILGGFTYSDSSGDMTQHSWGPYDYWVVKIDSSGIKQWDKRYGGTSSDQLFSLLCTTDGGYLLGGLSGSPVSGDKTQPNWGTGFDYWIVKIDSLGVKEWDKRFGGTGDEIEFGNISQALDGGYLIAGNSESSISGDKTENNLAPEQTWIVKTDNLGNKVWDKTLHTVFVTFYDEPGFAIQSGKKCYTFVNSTNAGIGGDKTQPGWGSMNDYWIIKYCDTSLTTSSNTISPFPSPLSIYPNPATNTFIINSGKLKVENGKLNIYDITGRQVFEEPIHSQLSTFNFQLTPGLYLVKVSSEEGVYTQKLVVE